MSRRSSRCPACKAAALAYCEHNHVLVVHMNGAPIVIMAESEDRARATADKFSMTVRGRPFHRRRVATT